MMACRIVFSLTLGTWGWRRWDQEVEVVVVGLWLGSRVLIGRKNEHSWETYMWLTSVRWMVCLVGNREMKFHAVKFHEIS